MDQRKIPVFDFQLCENGGGSILATVIDYDDFFFIGCYIYLRQFLEENSDIVFFVVTRHDDGNYPWFKILIGILIFFRRSFLMKMIRGLNVIEVGILIFHWFSFCS